MARKRAAGEGTLFRRKDGRWEGRVLVGYVDGRPKYKGVIRSTQAEAKAAWEQLKRQQAGGVNIAVPRQTLAQFTARWLDDVAAQRVRPGTRSTYALHLARINRHVGHVQLAKLTAQQLQAALAQLVRDGLSPRTVNVTRQVVVSALATAEQWDLIPRNVAARTDTLHTEPVRVVLLDGAAIERVLVAADAIGIGLAARLGVGLGLRVSEVLGLRWRDVDMAAGRLQIAVALQRVNGKPALVAPKTKAARRTLPLPPQLVTAFHAQRAHQLQQRLLAGTRWHEHGLVITTTIGTPVSAQALRQRFARVLRRAELPPMRFHDLRHSCATLLAHGNVHPRIAQQILGHANIRTTMDVYTHVRAGDGSAAALEGLEAAWTPLDEDDGHRSVS
jgi:integrase